MAEAVRSYGAAGMRFKRPAPKQPSLDGGSATARNSAEGPPDSGKIAAEQQSTGGAGLDMHAQQDGRNLNSTKCRSQWDQVAIGSVQDTLCSVLAVLKAKHVCEQEVRGKDPGAAHK